MEELKPGPVRTVPQPDEDDNDRGESGKWELSHHLYMPVVLAGIGLQVNHHRGCIPR